MNISLTKSWLSAVWICIFSSGFTQSTLPVTEPVHYENTAAVDDLLVKSFETGTAQEQAGLSDYLADLSTRPVNLNAAGEEEINTIPLLTPAQRKNLLDYLNTYGEILSIYELQSIPGFDTLMIRSILPFIIISPKSLIPPATPANLMRFGRHNLVLRYGQSFPKASGYPDNQPAADSTTDKYYLGSPQRYYFRYNYTWYDKVSLGLAGEKDPGEQFFKGAQSAGMDYYAGYLCLSNLGVLKNLTLGNFKATYGQGLTLGSGVAIGASPGFTASVIPTSGIRPTLGMSEGGNFRGLATTIKIKHIEISGFFSKHPRDGTISMTDTTSVRIQEITSLIETGYHRTHAELSKKNAVSELVCGGNCNMVIAPGQQFGFKVGVTVVYSKYSAILAPKCYPYNRFEFRGTEGLNTGIDWQIRFHGTYVFGEVSRSRNGGLAWLAGAVLNPDPRINLTIIYRNYQPGYQGLYANAFGQNSMNANEKGIFTSLQATIHPKIRVSGYLDLFTFPWLKYRVDIPTRGQEFGVAAEGQASRSVMITLRYYQKNTRINGSTVTGQIVHKLVETISRSYRIAMDWIPLTGILLKSRIDLRQAGQKEVNKPLGFLVYQEVQVKTLKYPENLTLRVALFDIPDYDSRIYVYEPEVLYGYSVPAYEGKGIRACLVTKFRLARFADLWLRGGLTWYTDRETAGSGLDATKGPIRCELSGQLVIRL